MKILLKAVLSTVALSCMIAPSVAQEWPTKPITLIVPFSVGGSTDITARLLADKLRNVLGQSVIVENRAGAGGNIGAAAVAKAAPDGYTLLMATSTHVTNPSLYKNLPYDVIKDFVPVAQIAFIPNLLAANKDLPVKNLEEFVRYVKENKGPVNYGSSGSGTSQHLAGALFNNIANGKMVHIPYKGGGAAVGDLLAGQIQVYFGAIPEVVSFVNAGKLKALGITTKERSPRFPDVPAINEVLPGYEVALWNGILAPVGTPAPVIGKLNDAIKKVLQNPEMQKRLTEQGSAPIGSSPEEFKKFMSSEVSTWARIVKASGAHVE
ncbi:MAG: transporter substrate-binding protein [Herminiimonas sp.]|nr:transporter substrate-binding protein [Herminiimonas sp.]